MGVLRSKFIIKTITLQRVQNDWIRSRKSINFSGLVQEMLNELIKEYDPNFYQKNIMVIESGIIQRKDFIVKLVENHPEIKQTNPLYVNKETTLSIEKPMRKSINSALRHEVFKRDSYTCAECGITNKESVLHVDHIISVSHGGKDEMDNLRTLCAECNRAKAMRVW